MKRIGNQKEKLDVLLLLLVLGIYFGAICLINLCGRPSFYNTDMYTDICFGVEAWKHKSLFPEGWLFGNQLYIVATPALAALFMAVTDNPVLAMSLASMTTSILVAISFLWMLKPVLPDFRDRLLGLVFFMTLGLYYGDSVGTENGWQLLFTMCSYYACYAVTCFLAFGCYLRADEGFDRKNLAIIVLTCILAFGTGMQSLRQTAVMTVPLLAVAALEALSAVVRKQPLLTRRGKLACAISVCNGLGLAAEKLVNVERNEIFGEMTLISPEKLISECAEGLRTMVSLLSSEDVGTCTVLVLVTLGSAFALWELLRDVPKTDDSQALELFLLLAFGVLGILTIDTLTTMEVRKIYYFMLYPLLGFLAGFLYSRRKLWGRYALLGVLSIVMLLPSIRALADVCMQAYFAKYDKNYEICDYLEEKGYTTIYTGWNQGEDVAVASKGEITAGFWDEHMFVPVGYLCNPEVYKADSEHCAYLLSSRQMETASELAKSKGIVITTVACFPKSDICILAAPVNLMQCFLEKTE